MSEWARTVKLGKRDASEPEVVKAFQAGGAEVVKHSGKDEPDLFVLFLGVWRPVETKTGPGKLSEGQIRWWREVARQRPCVVRTPPQARARLKVWRERSASTRIVWPNPLPTPEGGLQRVLGEATDAVLRREAVRSGAWDGPHAEDPEVA